MNKDLSQLKICGLLDELSEHFFPYECRFLNLDFNCWEDQITEFEPDILFVESIWNGYNKTWRRKLTPLPSAEFVELMNWCRAKKIPTVFWNKEDPIHFNTFLHVASYFDIVLTTDLDCIPLYKRLLGHEQVYCLPFATCPQMFTPLEKYKRKDGACFAGSYYNKREERKRDFEGIMDLLLKKGNVEIYDRNPYPGDPDYEYPDKYKSLIVGTLPANKIDVAYKSYKLGITLNIVKHSSTMQARRAFELLSCNTLVISNTCKGLENLFGDLIIYYDDPKKCEARLNQLLSNEILYEKIKLKGLRKVLSEHTYRERIAYVYELVYKRKPKSSWSNIAVYTVVNTQTEAERVVFSYRKQQYQHKKLFIFYTQSIQVSEQYDDIKVLPIDNMNEEFLREADYCAYFSPNNYYGENYLTDLVLSLKYENVVAVGKGCYYTFDAANFRLENSNKKYIVTNRLKNDRSIVSVEFKKSMGFLGTQEGEDYVEGVPCLSIDPFNFCEGYTYESCNLVDDIQINEGLSIDDIYNISESLSALKKYYNIPVSITGNELYNRLNTLDTNVIKQKVDRGIGLINVLDESRDVFIDKKFDVMENEKLTNRLTVYYNAVIEGPIKFYCAYYDQSDKYLGSYLVLNKGCTVIPIKKGAKYFKFYIRFEGKAHMIFKELILNPTIKNSILDDILSL